MNKQKPKVIKELVYDNLDTMRVVAKCLAAGITEEEINQLISPAIYEGIHAAKQCKGDTLKVLEYAAYKSLIKADEQGEDVNEYELWEDMLEELNDLKKRIENYEINKETKKIMKSLR